MIIESDIECASKAVHIMNFSAKSSFVIGRRVSSDISVSDISVSRKHATIQYFDDKVHLMDMNSKFGTFKQVKEPVGIEVSSREVLPLQIEKKCFFFKQENR